MTEILVRVDEWIDWENVLRVTGFLIDNPDHDPADPGSPEEIFLKGYNEKRIEKGGMLLAPGIGYNPEPAPGSWDTPPVYDDVHTYCNAILVDAAAEWDYIWPGPGSPNTDPAEGPVNDIWEWSRLADGIRNSPIAVETMTPSQRQPVTHTWWETAVTAAMATATQTRNGLALDPITVGSPTDAVALIWATPEKRRYVFL